MDYIFSLGPRIPETTPPSSLRPGRTFWGKKCNLGRRFKGKKCDLVQKMAENCDLGDEGVLVLFYGWKLGFGVWLWFSRSVR